VRRIQHAATAERDPARRRTFEKVSARGHVSLPEKPRFPAGRSIASLFLISSPDTLPSRRREGNDSRNKINHVRYPENAAQGECHMRSLASFASALALIASTSAIAQTNYPDRPIRMIVPLAAASAVDVAARIVTQKMADNMGQQFVIMNQPGASGLIGAEAVARAEPDGYTIGGFNDSIMTMVPNMQSKMRWDILKDFEPVSLVATVEWGLIANNQTSYKSAADLIAAAKAAPGKIDYGSGGPGSPQHLAMAMFASAAGISLTHVPYKGATQAATDVAAGQIRVGFQGLGTVAALVRGNSLKLIGVTTPNRLPQFPNVPTVSESGLPGFFFNSWFAILAPAGTPKEIIARLNAEVLKAVGDPEIRGKLENLGFTVRGSSAEELRVMTRDQLAKYARVIKEMGIANE
jgi:tripartite-type tricarboxylate transporter receptor subunit TctC